MNLYYLLLLICPCRFTFRIQPGTLRGVENFFPPLQEPLKDTGARAWESKEQRPGDSSVLLVFFLSLSFWKPVTYQSSFLALLLQPCLFLSG